MKLRERFLPPGRTLRRLQGAVGVVALVGYFGPWIGHEAAALAWNAYDLFHIARLLPSVESGQVMANPQALRLPLLGLAVLAPLLLRRAPLWQRGAAALLGAALAFSTLPPYPQILDAWRTSGWRVPFWWSIGTVGGVGLVALLGPRLALWGPWLIVAWTALTGLPAFATFDRLRPLIRALRAAPVRTGWGIWVCGGGLAFLALAAWLEGVRRPEEGA